MDDEIARIERGPDRAEEPVRQGAPIDIPTVDQDGFFGAFGWIVYYSTLLLTFLVCVVAFIATIVTMVGDDAMGGGDWTRTSAWFSRAAWSGVQFSGLFILGVIARRVGK